MKTIHISKMSSSMKTILPLLLAFILLTSCNIFSPNKPFNRGDGTEENPYHIATAGQMQRIEQEENLDKHFIQVKDIDASETSEFNDGKGFLPIGDIDSPFLGSYNGNGFKISELKLWIIDRQNSGLFGYAKNSRIENVTVSTSFDSICDFEKTWRKTKEQSILGDESSNNLTVENIPGAGWLVGYNDGGTIRNSTATGRFVAEVTYLGGLVGYNTGLIENSHYEGHATGLSSNGGLVGYNTGQIRNSHATGCVSSSRTVGGLAGFNFGGQISNSYAISRVSGSRAAGLVALQENGQIQDSYSSGEIMGTGDVSGGLVAINHGKIENSYSLSEFSESSESDNVGGIAGINKADGTITTSYSAGKLISEPGSTIGGISGLNEGVIESSYWDVTATEINTGTGSGNADGTTGLTTGQMTGPSAQENMPEFDWMNIWATTPDEYPILRWQQEN